MLLSVPILKLQDLQHWTYHSLLFFIFYFILPWNPIQPDNVFLIYDDTLIMLPMDILIYDGICL